MEFTLSYIDAEGDVQTLTGGSEFIAGRIHDAKRFRAWADKASLGSIIRTMMVRNVKGATKIEEVPIIRTA